MKEYDITREILKPFGRVVYQTTKGSTLYGLPGTRSDVDIRSIYIEPTASALSITNIQHTVERMVQRKNDIPVDLVAWEAKRLFHHLLKHNGNFVEMLLVPEDMCEMDCPEAHSLRRIAEKFVTKKLYKYYRGFAMNQFKRSNQQIRTGKGILYTYREMYAGIVVMRDGEIIFNWDDLRDRVEGAGLFKSEVLDAVSLDRTAAPSEMMGVMAREFDELNKLLDKSHDESELPKDYDGYEICNNALLQWRSRGWI